MCQQLWLIKNYIHVIPVDCLSYCFEFSANFYINSNFFNKSIPFPIVLQQRSATGSIKLIYVKNYVKMKARTYTLWKLLTRSIQNYYHPRNFLRFLNALLCTLFQRCESPVEFFITLQTVVVFLVWTRLNCHDVTRMYHACHVTYVNVFDVTVYMYDFKL